MELKALCITPSTHEGLKRVAARHGVKVGALADSVIRAWIAGGTVFLPKTLRGRYATSGRGARKAAVPSGGET